MLYHILVHLCPINSVKLTTKLCTPFPLQTDLCGIKWRRLGLGERPLATGEPLDDPVLSSYARCLAADILCVWRRVAAPKQELDATANLFDLNMSVSGGSGAVTHPPLSLTAAKELWIFWYGEEPDLSDLVAPELKKSAGKLTNRATKKWRPFEGVQASARWRWRCSCAIEMRACVGVAYNQYSTVASAISIHM